MEEKPEDMNETKSAVIFNVVHGSFVDGYGVRTTLFLKGCPLKCVWCCNPEGQKPYMELKFTSSICDGCGKCLNVCHAGAITLQSDPRESIVRIDRALCNNCMDCIDVCHSGALSCFGEKITMDDAFNVLNKDERYYSSSGGGVTIGGGEPTFLPDFTYALMEKCQSNHIHVAIDTCGYTINKLGFQILAEADLLLYDLKRMDKVLHQKQTGISTDLILSNLTKLSAMGKSIIVRIPLVPGCNDTERNIRETAEFLSRLSSIQRIDLLPYHKFGMVKYDQLGMPYGLQEVQSPSAEYIDKVIRIFESAALKTQLGG